jgi:hypothetical protein
MTACNETSNGGGNYNVGHTAGRVTSPVINLQGITTAELAFNYFLNVEIPPESDQPRVRISRDGGAFQTIGAKPDVLQSVPNPAWRSATLDLTAYVGSTIQLQFDFDTVDNLFNNLEGWYIDDVVVRGTGNGSHQVQLEFGDAIANLNFGDRQTEDSEPPNSEPPKVESDFNNDGKADIVWRNQADGTNLVWLMDGSNQIGMVTLPPIADPNWEIQGTGDFNGDSKTDMVWRNQTDGTNLVWLMDGTVQIGQVLLPPIADPNWEIQSTGDFNGDGKAEIVWRNQADGTNLVWLMDGTVQIGQVLLPPIADPNWEIQGTGDFNGDGKADIVWRNQADGTNLVWLMDGTVQIGQVLLPPITDPNWQM